MANESTILEEKGMKERGTRIKNERNRKKE